MVAGIILAILCSKNSNAQDTALVQFKKALNHYIDFTSRLIDSIPLNEKNNGRLSKQVDDQFKAFVLHPGSYQASEWVQSANNKDVRFIRVDARGSIYLSAFKVADKNYAVYSYTSRDKNNFFIKDTDAGAIVFDGGGVYHDVAGIYRIEDGFILLIVKEGDRNTSRTAMVLSDKKNAWVLTKSFEGKAFGQVPGQYFNKKFVKRREKFQLDCDFGVTMTAPVDVNHIQFDTASKKISYKQYTDARTYTLVTAQWVNNVFIIDDYNANENFQGAGM